MYVHTKDQVQPHSEWQQLFKKIILCNADKTESYIDRKYTIHLK